MNSIFDRMLKDASQHTHEKASEVAKLSAEVANSRKGAAATVSGVIECISAAASPLMYGLYQGDIPLQDRFLFTLILAGSCVTVIGSNEDGKNVTYGLECEVSPKNIQEAFRVFTEVTGRDVRPYVPQAMLNFADRQPTLN